MKTATASKLRAFIGPRHHHNASPFFWDWSQPSENTALGDNFAPSLAALIAAGQPASVGDATIAVNTTAGWPSAGGFWIRPEYIGQSWHYVDYSGKTASSFTGCKWTTAPNETEGLTAIPQFAQLTQFIALEPDQAAQFEQSVHITMMAAGQFAGTNWNARISGFNAARHITSGYLVILQERANEQQPWANILTGWTEAPSISDDHQRQAAWNLNIVSGATMAERYYTKETTIGDRDIATDGSASASNTLTVPYKERSSPDFTEAEPDLSAGKTIDRDISSLWIADQYVGSLNYSATNGDPTIYYDDGWWTQAVISLIYLRRPPGFDSVGYRYIELTAIPQPPDGTTSIRDHVLYSEKNDVEQWLDIGGSDVEEGEKILICEDKELFDRENALNAYATIVELPDAAFWDALDPAGDTIVLRRNTAGNPWESDTMCHGVQWGNATGNMNQLDPEDGGTWDRWSGSNAPAPLPGQSIRYLFFGKDGTGTSTTAGDYWETAYNVIPGYTVGVFGGDEDGFNQGKIHEPWLQIELPPLQHYLKSDVSAALGAGGYLYIVDADDQPNTEGLPTAGTIQISLEQITYDQKTDSSLRITGRGANTTTPEDHLAGDQVAHVDASGIASIAAPIESIKWSRARTGGPYPTRFQLYTTNRVRQRRPGDEAWERDWTLRHDEPGFNDPGGDTIDFVKTFNPPIRVTYILFVFELMSQDPARPRLNEVYAMVSPDDFTGEDWSPSGTTAAEVAGGILVKSGAMPAAALTLYLTTYEVDETEIAAGPAYSTALDICDYAHAYMEVELDSRITIRPHPWMEAGALNATYTWTRATLKSLSIQQTAPGPIQQYRLDYTAQNGDAGLAIYPPDESLPDDGEPAEVGPYITSSGATAANSARRRYLFARLPYQASAELAQGRLDLRPGQLHNLQWDFGPHEPGAPAQFARLHVAESIDLLWDNGTLTTAINFLQADRVAEN